MHALRVRKHARSRARAQTHARARTHTYIHTCLLIKRARLDINASFDRFKCKFQVSTGKVVQNHLSFQAVLSVVWPSEQKAEMSKTHSGICTGQEAGNLQTRHKSHQRKSCCLNPSVKRKCRFALTSVLRRLRRSAPYVLGLYVFCRK